MQKYIDIYKKVSTDSGYWDETLELEELGKLLADDFDRNKDRSLEFINRVEYWKAMGDIEKTIGARVNTEVNAKNAIKNILNKKGDRRSNIEELHTLTGFGKSGKKGEHPAKVASAVMRFLYPEIWGVVDWRSGFVAQSLITNQFNIDKTIELIRNNKNAKKEAKDSFKLINSEWAIMINDQYKIIGDHFNLQKNSVIDQGIFGISLEIWPINKLKKFIKCNHKTN